MIIIELGDIILRFDQRVFDRFIEFIQDDNLKPESGGIIMGYYIDDYSFYISDLTTPSKNDKGARFNFIRSFVSAQKALVQIFKDSRGKKIYLGEWHTHPEKLPSPSATDLESLGKQLKTNVLNSKFIFMIIVGIEGVYAAMHSKAGLICYKRITFLEILSGPLKY